MDDEEDEDRQDIFGLPDDPALVDALMGWDGDPCACPECTCPKFRDSDDLRCADCRAGDHWPANA